MAPAGDREPDQRQQLVDPIRLLQQQRRAIVAAAGVEPTPPEPGVGEDGRQREGGRLETMQKLGAAHPGQVQIGHQAARLPVVVLEEPAGRAECDHLEPGCPQCARHRVPHRIVILEQEDGTRIRSRRPLAAWRRLPLRGAGRVSRGDMGHDQGTLPDAQPRRHPVEHLCQQATVRTGG
jgi:hypothetical protein